MIKKLFYYFKFKQLLKRYELTSFIYFVLKYQRKSFFKMATRRNPRLWFNYLIASKDILDYLANCYSSIDQKSITKRFNQAKDYWMKFVRL